MPKDAAITVRVSPAVKRKLQHSARAAHRSLSAQAATALARAVMETPTPAEKPVRILGRFAKQTVPNEHDFAEVRAILWANVPRSSR